MKFMITAEIPNDDQSEIARYDANRIVIEDDDTLTFHADGRFVSLEKSQIVKVEFSK